ncbi:MAG: hypothetical protein HYR88_16040 [Verrucomicrobia bacterium]|nr:hypothetical protein [Verrucomicrobiota bacterium]MBI3868076.1 hypothetical protein [Verrucomicrobiota bacterium]
MNQSNVSAWAAGLPVAVLVLVGFGFFVAYMVIKGAICFFVINALKRVPPEHRRIEPAMVWLLMIPCFSWIWNFIVFQKTPDSFKSFFSARGRGDHGDCGKGLGLAFAIVELVWSVPIPLVGAAAWLAGWVLLIISLVKYHELAGEVTRSLSSPTPASSPLPPASSPPL